MPDGSPYGAAFTPVPSPSRIRYRVSVTLTKANRARRRFFAVSVTVCPTRKEGVGPFGFDAVVERLRGFVRCSGVTRDLGVPGIFQWRRGEIAGVAGMSRRCLRRFPNVIHTQAELGFFRRPRCRKVLRSDCPRRRARRRCWWTSCSRSSRERRRRSIAGGVVDRGARIALKSARPRPASDVARHAVVEEVADDIGSEVCSLRRPTAVSCRPVKTSRRDGVLA